MLIIAKRKGRRTMNYISGLIFPALAVAVIGYLIGSISFSILVTKKFKNKEDIRTYGSGNAGATNVLRSVGKLPAALTFILDFLKCVLSVLIGYYTLRYFCTEIGAPMELAIIGKYTAGIGCVIGHIFPIYFHFKGGKGVVTSAAMIALLDWRVFFPALAVFIIVFAIKKIVSLGSIIGFISYPIWTFLITFFFDCTLSPLKSHGDMSILYVVAVTFASTVLSAIIIIGHRSNIKRLLAGEEKPITFGDSKNNEQLDI